ncbi:DUF4935 domain-containing protein [Rhodobacteraceae bacterium R_SAG2]|nr:DUF4935 domain-containing protein [Rhodobacteraceae bacterium R_SAG2]
MRSQFRGHFELSSEEIKKLWQEASFVFDANVLLNLYRYSSEATKEFLQLLNLVGDRVWIPEQCAYEFLSNRHSVLHEQATAYDKTLEEIRAIRQKFAKKRGHPFISEENSAELDRIVEAISSEFEAQSKEIRDRFSDDETLNAIADIFDGRVGEAYGEEDLKKRFEDGEKRFAGETPPGYKDSKKVKEPRSLVEQRRNFGDYLLWAQTLEKSQKDKSPVILVTDDRKEDWWRIVHGRTVGPRPELISEFYKVTGESILIYSPEQFLKFSSDHLDFEISQNTIGEVEAEKNARERRVVGKEPDPLVERGTVAALRRWANVARSDLQEKEMENQRSYPKYSRRLESLMAPEEEKYAIKTRLLDLEGDISQVRQMKRKLLRDLNKVYGHSEDKEAVEGTYNEFREIEGIEGDLKREINFLRSKLIDFDGD